MSFSAKAFVRFDFTAAHNKDDVEANIARAPYQGSGTATGAALQLVHRKLFVPEAGFRGGKVVVILITDGESQEEQYEVFVAADELHQQAEVFTIGVGPEAAPWQLAAIASEPSTKHMMFLSMEQMRNGVGIGTLVKQFACDG